MNIKAALFFLFVINSGFSQNFKELKTHEAPVYYAILPSGQGLLGDRMIYSPPESIPNGNGKYFTIFKEDTTKIAWAGFYKNSKRDSSWIEYWPQGQIFATYTYANGKLNGKLTHKLRNGHDWHIQFYKNGLADSTWTWYDPRSNTPGKIEHYKNGLLNGELLIYENGNLLSKMNMSNGKLRKNDTLFNYYLDGKKLSTLFYQNDNLIMISHWDQDGKQVIKNGSGLYHGIPDKYGKYEIGNYKNGLKDGDWQKYKTTGNSNGKLLRTETYKNGKNISLEPNDEDDGN